MSAHELDKTAALPKFRRSYRKSEVIFDEGSTGGEMYLIHSGRVVLTARQNEAEQVALVDDCPRSATAAAVEDGTELIVMDRARFLFMVRQQPEFALSLMHTLCQRLREMDKRFSPEGAFCERKAT
jgi:CRP/FNR family cyclic AMP-dependent transcriptional regulator